MKNVKWQIMVKKYIKKTRCFFTFSFIFSLLSVGLLFGGFTGQKLVFIEGGRSLESLGICGQGSNMFSSAQRMIVN